MDWFVMDSLFVPLTVGAGALLVVQAGANAQLSKAAGSPFGATTLQLSAGMLVLLIAAAATGGVGALRSLCCVPWWHAVGGAASAFYVVSAILLFPRLGAVMTTGLAIAGQVLTSLVLDHFGLIGIAPKSWEAGSAAGAIAVLAGATLIVSGQKGHESGLNLSKVGWIVLAILAGAVLPVQGALNGLLHRGIGAPFSVGLVSFFVATLTMATVLALVVLLLHGSTPKLSGVLSMPWWGWLGGFAGATYVTAMFTAILVIGTAAAVGLTVAGQQTASLAVDRYGWFRLPRRPISATRIVGVTLLLTGVFLIKLA